MPHPERGRCAQCQQQRQERLHARHHFHATARIRRLHVHVQAAQQVALPQHLQLAHHVVVMGLVGTELAAPLGRGVRAGHHDAQSVPLRDRGDRAAQRAQVLFGRVRVIVYQGLDFDLGLQHLAAEAFAQRFPAFGEEAPRHVAQPAAVAAYQEVLFLEAERVGMSGGPGCGGHLRVIAPAG